EDRYPKEDDKGNVIPKPKQLLAGKTVHNAMRLLSVILEDAREDGFTKINPMIEKQGRGKNRKKRTAKFTCKPGRALRPEEATKLLAKAEGDVKTKIRTLLLSGVREGELFGLSWEDIDFVHDKIHVRKQVVWRDREFFKLSKNEPSWAFAVPKYHSMRAIDMSPVLKQELKAHYLRAKDKSPKALAFPSEAGTPVNPSNFYNREFQPVVTAACIGKLKPHDCRHSFGSWKIEQAGESRGAREGIIGYVSRQMGHKDIATTLRHYTHLIESSRPDVAAATDA